MKNGALDDALESERLLNLGIYLRFGDDGNLGINEIHQVTSEFLELRIARKQYFTGGRIIDQGKQQVLDRNEFMEFAAGSVGRNIQGAFKFSAKHNSRVFWLEI